MPNVSFRPYAEQPGEIGRPAWSFIALSALAMMFTSACEREESLSAIEGFDISLNETEYAKCRRILEAFGAESGYRARAARVSPDPDQFIIDLVRGDILIIGTNAVDKSVCSIGIYPRKPHQKPSDETVQKIAEDIKARFGAS